MEKNIPKALDIGTKDKYDEYKNEFYFKTNVNDLKRIYIIQKSREEMVIDGVQTKMDLFRKTKYDIYILSEKDFIIKLIQELCPLWIIA